MSAAAVAPPVDAHRALERRKTDHMLRIWQWLLSLKPQPCGNCASELAIVAVERDVNGSTKPISVNERLCRKRSLAGEACFVRVRPLWKGRPREEGPT